MISISLDDESEGAMRVCLSKADPIEMRKIIGSMWSSLGNASKNKESMFF